jgi:hypothetical protein
MTIHLADLPAVPRRGSRSPPLTTLVIRRGLGLVEIVAVSEGNSRSRHSLDRVASRCGAERGPAGAPNGACLSVHRSCRPSRTDRRVWSFSALDLLLGPDGAVGNLARRAGAAELWTAQIHQRVSLVAVKPAGRDGLAGRGGSA